MDGHRLLQISLSSAFLPGLIFWSSALSCFGSSSFPAAWLQQKKSGLPSPMSSALSCFGSSSFPAAWLQQKKWAPIAHECCIELLWLLVVSCSLAAGNDEEPQQLNAELISDGSPLFFAAARLQKTTRSQSSSMQNS